MNKGTPRSLNDDAARLAAITELDRSILVEAGAGSGKTAVMAGRIAVLLASGAAPGSIAAVTFTELAASELLVRVREFATGLSVGDVPAELRIAFPNGLSCEFLQNLRSAIPVIDEITCSTIHGFCQRLIKPYPAEANIDPGAKVMDSKQADLTFLDIAEDWLRDHLSKPGDGVLAEMVLQEPGKTVGLVREIAQNLRRHRVLQHPTLDMDVGRRLDAFVDATVAFGAFLGAVKVQEPETGEIVRLLGDLASQVKAGASHTTPAGWVRILILRPDPVLMTQTGTFRAYKKAGKWATAAKSAGLSVAQGKQLNLEAQQHYEACCLAWDALLQATAGEVLAKLVEETKPILERYRNYKRDSAQLDFDDLIFSARDLLRDHGEVRRALGDRFKYVLVDEFQDTDPLQAEIFWRLCGEPVNGTTDWTQFEIRPGALFLVGDPKQAIYRFRGADISAYTRARDAFQAQLVSISTNFRSCASILSFVNGRFELPLTAEGQPGFTALDPFHGDPRPPMPCVVALDIAVPVVGGNVKAHEQRDAEADAVAELCARLIGSQMVIDRRSATERPCQPGDIALLAPTGTDLWRYEEALEERGIPVATQAGKGFYRRQEIQDLMAITRVLADSRDTLALGALLRGPLIGLTEERLMDIVWALPRSDEEPNLVPRLSLRTDAGGINDAEVQGILRKLQSLARGANGTTPHQVLSEAIDVLRVRPILLQRHGRQSERALANVDLYLSLSQGYSVRGLRAFAEAMTAAWTDETRAIEGRPDAQEAAVSLFTMHAAKGLEWPIVMPINTMTLVNPTGSSVFARETGTFYCPVLGIAPKGHEEALQREKDELARERVRLWYVAATRARELLILPRIDADQSDSAWIQLVDLNLVDLPPIDLSALPATSLKAYTEPENGQTAETFAAEAQAIADRTRRLAWVAPSRDEGIDDNAADDTVRIWADSPEGSAGEPEAALPIQGSRYRGLILHKLMEDVLTGETGAEKASLVSRADVLIGELGRTAATDPANGLSADELAACVVRTLALQEIAALRPGLHAEVPLYASQTEGNRETVTAGIADAIARTPDGHPDVVVDWKSDVNPDKATLDRYRHQVGFYLKMTGASCGYIVLMTSGKVITVEG